MTQDDHAARQAKVAAQFISILPHARVLGLQIKSVSGGMAEVIMPYSAALIGDPHTGVVHGGAVSALMDTACGAAVLIGPDPVTSTATLSLRINYMRPATPGQTVTARAFCYSMKRHIAFVEAKAFDDNENSLVATASGTFTVTKGARDASS